MTSGKGAEGCDADREGHSNERREIKAHFGFMTSPAARPCTRVQLASYAPRTAFGPNQNAYLSSSAAWEVWG